MIGDDTTNQDGEGASLPRRLAEQADLQPSPAARGTAAGALGDPLYVAKLAHEIKTPLSAIVAAAEIMRDERLGPIGNERYRGYVADIYESARHALDVINNMLGSSKGERAIPNLQFSDIDLNVLAENTVSSMLPLAHSAGLTLQLALAPRLPRVVADGVTVKQILLNVLTNAVKFTPAGGQVLLSTRYQLDGPVEIEVRDTGKGMSESEIAHGLDKDRPPLSGPREGGGLGLGLPLVRTLAEANGAKFDIKSAPGEGTTVTLSFPKARVVPV